MTIAIGLRGLCVCASLFLQDTGYRQQGRGAIAHGSDRSDGKHPAVAAAAEEQLGLKTCDKLAVSFSFLSQYQKKTESSKFCSTSMYVTPRPLLLLNTLFSHCGIQTHIHDHFAGSRIRRSTLIVASMSNDSISCCRGTKDRKLEPSRCCIKVTVVKSPTTYLILGIGRQKKNAMKIQQGFV